MKIRRRVSADRDRRATGARFARTRERVEELGFSHLLAYDHVLGADPEVAPPWNGPYNIDTTFHEPFVLFGYLAAITSIELVTGIIILPQRQTALVAKQAAEVDLLDRWAVPARHRARLERGGVRGARHELLRPRRRGWASRSSCCAALWTQRSVTYDGTYEHVTGAGLAPLPIQRPIPDLVRRRVGAGLAARRPAGRRMVPAGAAGPGARRGAHDRRGTAARAAGRDPSRDRDGRVA